MTAMHLKVTNLATGRGKARAESTLGGLRGVAGVAAVASAHLVSVLYDETMTSARQVLRTLRGAGFDARPVGGLS